ncbi:PoNe immunity protein domain-containing protein [Clostridium neonatale]|uniref:PoNe immunity protein domain-containing protein n=1 Tax=Clostridium neonatale TaxID=137838 RepID=UPI001E2BA3D3|nr:PoNe immunity protein domain-containing protein [Clostridium neonatale]
MRNNKDILEIKNDILNGVRRYPISNLEVLDNKYKSIVVKCIDKIRAMYSRGDLLEEFDDIWNEAVEAFINIKEKKIGYLYLLWIVGIGILLEVPKDLMRKVEECVKRESIKDFVLQLLLDGYLDNSDPEEICFEKENPYKK